jgi:hypothetical protein
MKKANRLNFIISLIFIVACSLQAAGQEVLLHQDVDSNNILHRKWGPNEPIYLGSYVYYGFFTGSTDLQVKKGLNSFSIGAGLFYKRKISRIFSAGLLTGYRYGYFSMKELPGYSLTDSLFWHKETTHKKEKIFSGALSLQAFIRVNFDPHRGDIQGKYIEIGGGPDLTLNKGYETLDITPDKMRVHTRFSNIPYLSTLPEYVYARIAFNSISLGVAYRLTSYFKPQYNLHEPPQYLVKIELVK